MINTNLWFCAGAIRDWTGSYPLCIHSQSVCIALCCAVWIGEYVYGLCRRKALGDDDADGTDNAADVTAT